MILALALWSCAPTSNTEDIPFAATIDQQYEMPASIEANRYKYELWYVYDVTLELDVYPSAQPAYTREFSWNFESKKNLMTIDEAKKNMNRKVAGRYAQLMDSTDRVEIVEMYNDIYQADRFYRRVLNTPEENNPIGN